MDFGGHERLQRADGADIRIQAECLAGGHVQAFIAPALWRGDGCF